MIASAATEPTWLTVGGTVYVSRGGMTTTYTKATIAKLTARDVVLDNGSRFSRLRLQRYEPGHWGSSLKLVGPDDEAMLEAVEADRTRIIRQHAAASVARVLEAWRRNGDPDGPAAAIAVLRDAVDQIAGGQL